MKALYDTNEIIILAEETGRLKPIEVKYMARFDGCVIKFVSDDDSNRLVISAKE